MMDPLSNNNNDLRKTVVPKFKAQEEAKPYYKNNLYLTF